MKYTVNRITEGDDELILNYKNQTAEIDTILQFMNNRAIRLIGRVDGETVPINADDLLYVEIVDDRTFAYLAESVVQLEYSLNRLEAILSDIKFFRCSKSMIVNIDKVERLKSLPSNRIDAVMQGGEHILISRTYASEFRKILKGGL